MANNSDHGSNSSSDELAALVNRLDTLGQDMKKLKEGIHAIRDDEDGIAGIIDYLKPTSYEGFIDLDDEEYNNKRCKLLGMPYIKPLPIIIKQVKITRYSLGPGEVYTKLEVLNVEESP
nr:hypothetical protein [Tanacetum cinerariifolium]